MKHLLHTETKKVVKISSTVICALLLCIQSGNLSAQTQIQTQGSNPNSVAINELQKIDTQVGSGAEARTGTTVSVHYTGWLYDGATKDHRGGKFDSSLSRGQPFNFPLGAGRVIRGWDEGVVGMKVGGKRTLIIPAQMGYGASGAGGGLIPPNATLIFDVELLGVK